MPEKTYRDFGEVDKEDHEMENREEQMEKEQKEIEDSTKPKPLGKGK